MACIVDLRKKAFFLNPIVLLLSAGYLFLAACHAPLKTIRSSKDSSVSQIRLLDVYELPTMMHFKGTTVGGLSGIDYDAGRDLYYLICDDRSDINPSRFYTAHIRFTEKGIDTILFLDAITLLDKSKRPYASRKEDPIRRTDPEGIRYDPKRDVLFWSNEGERGVVEGKMLFSDPSVSVIDRKGQFLDSFFLPANMHVHSTESGIRKNGAFEGLSLDSDAKFLYVSVEEPLYEDGPRAGLGDSTAWIRFIKFDTESKKQVAQYAYEVDAVPYPANPPGEYKINGVPEILYIGDDKLLVIERAFSTGRQLCAVRIYIADLSKAEDVSGISSLRSHAGFRPITKKLLLNMDELGRHIDNIEAVSFGPKLPNGNSTLIFVTDDNFDTKQKTQFFLFEVIR